MTTNGKVMVYLDNDELHDPTIQAAVLVLKRTTGFTVCIENPHFLGEVLPDEEVVRAVTTDPWREKVLQAARATLFKTGKEIKVIPLLAPGVIETHVPEFLPLTQEGSPVVGSLLTSAALAALPALATPPGATASAGVSPADFIQPLTPAPAVEIQPVNLSPVGNPEARLFDVAELEAVSEPIGQAMKRAGYTTVGACREVTAEDLQKLPGIGKRMADRIVSQIAAALPPPPAPPAS